VTPSEETSPSDVPPEVTPQSLKPDAQCSDCATVMYPIFYQIVREYAGMAVTADHRYGPVSFMTKEDRNHCQAASGDFLLSAV
jgi:hypothetical protein